MLLFLSWAECFGCHFTPLPLSSFQFFPPFCRVGIFNVVFCHSSKCCILNHWLTNRRPPEQIAQQQIPWTFPQTWYTSACLLTVNPVQHLMTFRPPAGTPFRAVPTQYKCEQIHQQKQISVTFGKLYKPLCLIIVCLLMVVEKWPWGLRKAAYKLNLVLFIIFRSFLPSWYAAQI